MFIRRKPNALQSLSIQVIPTLKTGVMATAGHLFQRSAMVPIQKAKASKK